MKRDDEQKKRLWECQKLLFKADEVFQDSTIAKALAE